MLRLEPLAQKYENHNTMALQRLSYLDGWRGLSILCVLQGHFIKLPIDLGGFGVCMFFCLSGMLMSNILFIDKQRLSKFYRRRVSRILPAFFVFITIIYLLSDYWNKVFSWPEYVSTLLFTRTYYPWPGIWGTGMPIGHIWSLNVEEHAYMFMSLLTLIPKVRERGGIFLILFGSVCIIIGFIYIKLGNRAPFWGSLGSEVAASFLLISAGYRLLRERFKNIIPPWLPIFSLLTAIAISQSGPWWLHPMASPFLLAIAVNHISESYTWFQHWLSSRVLQIVGIWSFSIYLWQQPFYASKSVFIGGSLCALISAMIVSIISFYMIEQPCRTWLNNNWKS